MTFKQWVNELTIGQSRAFACQHGMRGWVLANNKDVRAFLVRSDSAKEQFKAFYGS